MIALNIYQAQPENLEKDVANKFQKLATKAKELDNSRQTLEKEN